MKEIPTLSANLIKELAKDEPNIDIHFGMGMAEIQYKAGRWSVINELLTRLKYDTEERKPSNKTETIL